MNTFFLFFIIIKFKNKENLYNNLLDDPLEIVNEENKKNKNVIIYLIQIIIKWNENINNI